MHIRRDYNQPFFRGHKRGRKRQQRHSHLPRNLSLLLGFMLIVGFLLYTQPAMMQSVAGQLGFIEMTPTPMPSQLATQANDLYWQGQLEGAADLLEQAVLQRPDNIDYIYEYGQLLIDLNRPDEALVLAERITAINPEDVRGFALRSRALVWRGEGAAAVPVGLAGLQLDPNFPPLYAALSRAYAATAAWREAQEYGLMATEMNPSDVRNVWSYANSLMQVGAHDAAMIELERAIDAHPFFLPPYFELAYLYLSADRDQDAIDLYDRILGLEPRNARALMRQCDAYRKTGEFQRALGLCQDAVDADPTLIAAQYRLGLLRYNRREFTAAQGAFSACLAGEPGNLECHYRLGLTYYYLDDCQTSWDMLQESLIMAQSQSAVDSVIETIRTGLTAIDSDPKCIGIQGTIPDILLPDSNNGDT